MARITAIALLALTALSFPGPSRLEAVEQALPETPAQLEIAAQPIQLVEPQSPAGDPSASLTPAPDASDEDEPEVATEDPVIAWARHRFEAAELDLPDIDIVVYDSTIDCDGRVGYYFADAGRLELCSRDRKAVLHELAHAWADHNLTDEDRVGFAQLRNLTDWNDRGAAWEHRATEHAAETLMWALMDRETTVRWIEDDGTTTRRLLTIDDSTPAELAEAYRFLTGRDVPFDRSLVEADTQRSISTEMRRAGQ